MKRKYEIAVVSRGAFARTLRIFAPKNADRALIMHDGQNVFYDEDAGYGKSWRVFDILRSCGIKNTAVIGIDSTNTREFDYVPFRSELQDYGVTTMGGGADVYADYIQLTVIPYLEKRFGYRKFGILGSSAGALASIHIAARKISEIKAYGFFSTPLFLSPKAYEGFFESCSFDKDAYYSIYVGGRETAGEIADPAVSALVPQLYVDNAFKLTNVLRAKGVIDIKLDMNNTAEHDEISWRAPAREFIKKFASL